MTKEQALDAVEKAINTSFDRGGKVAIQSLIEELKELKKVNSTNTNSIFNTKNYIDFYDIQSLIKKYER